MAQALSASPANTGASWCRAEEFAAFVGSLAARGYVGANVTVPHKEAALALSEPDERARAVGAVNTLWLDNGDVLRSTNTDVEGFLDNLDACAPGWDRDAGKAVVLGAGGAARAVIYGLLTRGVERIVVVNRTLEPRRNVAPSLSAGACIVARWDEVGADLADAALLSIPRRSACKASPISPSISHDCPVTPLSPTSSMCRY